MTNQERRKARIAKRLKRRRQYEQLTAAEQRRRDAQADIDRQLRRWPRRRIAAWALFVLGGLVAIQHIIAHAGFRPIPVSMGWQDLLIGYPMAGVLLIAGLFVLEPRRQK